MLIATRPLRIITKPEEHLLPQSNRRARDACMQFLFPFPQLLSRYAGTSTTSFIFVKGSVFYYQ